VSGARLVLLLAVALSAEAKKPPKPPKPPSQPPITYQCVTVYDIYSHAFGVLSSIASGPGLDAKIRNDCGRTVQVFVRIGYFNGRGGQFGDGVASATVAPGAVYLVTHEMYPPMYRDVLKVAKVVKVEAYAD